MAKITELTDAQLQQQIVVFKKKVLAGDESQKKVLIALMKEKKGREGGAPAPAKAAPPPEAPKEKVATSETVEEDSPKSPKKKGLAKGKKSIGGPKGKSKIGSKRVGIKKKSSGDHEADQPKSKGTQKSRTSGASAKKSARSKKPKAPTGDKTAIGTPRKPLMVILFSIITFGIYSIVYYYKTFGELKRYRGQGWSNTLALVFTLIPVVNIVGIIIPWILSAHIGKLYEEDGQNKPVSGMTGCWILLPLAGPFIWVFKIQGALNNFWISKGADDFSSKDDEEEEDDDSDDEDIIEDADDLEELD